MMAIKTYSILASIYMLAAVQAAHADCSAPLTHEIANAARIVSTLRFDKSAQMRVMASDGSEYTAGQTAWMKGRLRAIARSCDQGDEATATASLRDVESLLRVHQRKS